MSKPLEKLGIDIERFYKKKGFKSKVGYGKHPALLIIDLAVAWTDPTSRLGTNLDSVVESTKEVLNMSRKKKLPIIYTVITYHQSLKDAGLWVKKIPALADAIAPTPYIPASQVDPRIKPKPNEIVLTKKFSSAFFGTNLAALLNNLGVDTIIVTGCSTSACVRATVTDGLGYGFRTIVPRECVGDRVPAANEWNLIDIDAKFGDVVSKKEVLKYLKSL